MKRRLMLLNVLLFSIIKLYSFSLFSEYEIDPAKKIKLEQDGTATIIFYDGKRQISNFEYEQNEKFTFLRFPKNDIIYNEDKITQVLLLVGKQIEKDYKRNFAIGFSDKGKKFIRDCPRSMEGYCYYKDCTSYLTEGDKKYTIDNLSEIRIDSPWVEGVSGNGEGEGFTIEGNAPFLLIVNGFISVKKPYLYEQNSRIKTIRVTGSKSGNTKVLEVLDTPNPQTVDISFLDKEDDTIVRIDSVYEGSKYQDTCISLCKLYGKMVIPYLGED